MIMTRLAIVKSAVRLGNHGGAGILLAAFLALPFLAAGQVRPGIPDPIVVKVNRVYRLPFFCVEEGLQAGRAIRHCPALATETDWTTPVPDTPCVQRPEKPASCAPTAPAATLGKKPKKPAPKTIYVPPGNADDIAKQLQPQSAAGTPGTASVSAAAVVAGTATASATGTGVPPANEFVLTATADKRSIVIFCRDRICVPNAVTTLERAIYDLAKPRYSYFKDYPIHSEKTGKAFAKALP